MLQGFEQYFFKKEPELTISQSRGVFFNAGTVQALGKCEYVQIFFKDSERALPDFCLELTQYTLIESTPRCSRRY